jgi:hypothetical protein
MPTKYTVFCVDLFGLAVASYDLHAGVDDAAKAEARQFLASHSSVEVWDGPDGLLGWSARNSLLSGGIKLMDQSCHWLARSWDCALNPEFTWKTSNAFANEPINFGRKPGSPRVGTKSSITWLNRSCGRPLNRRRSQTSFRRLSFRCTRCCERFEKCSTLPQSAKLPILAQITSITPPA